MATSNNPALKEKVKAFWESSPCGTYKIDELGIPEGTKEYFDKIDEFRYTKRPYKYDFLYDFADFKNCKGKKVLEIGCSVGTDLSQFAKAGADVTGIDLTSAGIELAKKRFQVLGLQGDLRVADAENLPFADNTFDIVYSFGVLHHTPDTKKAINEEAYRVLKPGGKAVIILYHKVSYNFLFLNYKAIRRRHLWSLSYRQRLNVLTESNKNADGVMNPLTKIYTKSEAQHFFSNYRDVKMDIRWLNLWWNMPAALEHFLERKFGWYLIVTAKK